MYITTKTFNDCSFYGTMTADQDFDYTVVFSDSEGSIIEYGDKKKTLTLYECTKMFIETMDNDFPDACENSGVFLVATDGKKVSAMFNGNDELITDVIVHYIIYDKTIRDILDHAFDKALRYLTKQ